MKHANIFIIYIATLLVAAIIFTPSHVTTNMFSIFQKDKNIQTLMTVNSFEKTSTLLVTIKDFNDKNLNTLNQIKQKLQRLSYVKDIKLDVSQVEIPKYIQKYYFILSTFHPINLNNTTIKDRLHTIKKNLMDNFIYQPIDKNDPLSLFNFTLASQTHFTKDNYLALGTYGYLLTAQLDVKQNDIETAQRVEKELQHIFKPYKDVTAFSTLFFAAQNSKIIKNNVHTILYISFALLILLFLITLRDPKLLIANTISLASSIFVALSFSTFFFTELSIFTLAFGAAISSISVDYLFHNYFHKHYLKKHLNKTIFIAFLTTVLGFTLLQFVSFPLISQLSVFALISLSFSYFQFTFIYPIFKFIPSEKRLKINYLFKVKPLLPINLIFIFSILTIIYTSNTLKFDYNLKNLDYDNQTLKQKQQIIQNNVPKKVTLLLEAPTIDSLIDIAHKTQEKTPSLQSIATVALTQAQFKKRLHNIKVYDFPTLKKYIKNDASSLGFKTSYFSSAYDFISNIPEQYIQDKDTFKALGYEIIEKDGKFYTLATVNKTDLLEHILSNAVQIIEPQDLLQKTTVQMFSDLLIYLTLASIAMLIIILYTTKEKTILTLNFILFPVAMILLYLSFSAMNIMHLFSIIIIIVAGVDYGIYMTKENTLETKEAIFYSLLTSFAGFGILILSSIGAIHSIGVVISIGLLSILILILFLKNYPQSKF